MPAPTRFNGLLCLLWRHLPSNIYSHDETYPSRVNAVACTTCQEKSAKNSTHKRGEFFANCHRVIGLFALACLTSKQFMIFTIFVANSFRANLISSCPRFSLLRQSSHFNESQQGSPPLDHQRGSPLRHYHRHHCQYRAKKSFAPSPQE